MCVMYVDLFHSPSQSTPQELSLPATQLGLRSCHLLGFLSDLNSFVVGTVSHEAHDGLALTV